MDYICLRNCYVGERLWKEGETYALPDAMEKSPKNFRPIGQPPKPAPSVAPESKSVEGAIVCPTCGRKFSHKIALSGHLRTHKDKS